MRKVAGKKIDLASAPAALLVTTWDIMETYGCSRSTITVMLHDGRLPPPLQRTGKLLTWTAGMLRDWNTMRAERALSLSKKNLYKKTSVFG